MALTFSRHAIEMMEERKILRAWVDQVLHQADWLQTDPSDPNAIRAFGTIQEARGKILRVVYTDIDEARHIVTVFFDRKAKRPGH